MDLIQPMMREEVFESRVSVVRRKTAETIAIVRKQQPEQGSASPGFNMGPHTFPFPSQGQSHTGNNQTPITIPQIDTEMQLFATSIWDQSLYKAWASREYWTRALMMLT